MARDIAAALDSSLDDMISQNKGGRKKGKGKGAGKGKGKGSGDGNKVKKTATKQKSDKAGGEKPKQKAAVGTAKALDMSLEDIVKSQTKGNKPKQAAQNAGAKKGPKKLWGGAAKVFGKRKGDAKGKGKGGDKKGWGKGKSKGKGKGKGGWSSKGDWKGRKKGNGKNDGWGGRKQWGGDNWGGKKDWGGKSGGKSDWGKGKDRDDWGGRDKGKGRGKDRWEDEYGERWVRESKRDWSPPPRRQDSWTRKDSGGPDWARKERDSDSWRRDKGSSDRWERDSGRPGFGPRGGEERRGGRGGIAVEDLGRPRKRPAPYEDDGPPPMKKIRVKNIPRDLNEHDIRDAFEGEAGKIAKIIMKQGEAWIEFVSAKDARKAVDTFDRGELNGKTIEVIFDR